MEDEIMAIIDRFEGDYAVVEMEDGDMVNIHRNLLPDATEGDRIYIRSESDKMSDDELDEEFDDTWE